MRTIYFFTKGDRTVASSRYRAYCVGGDTSPTPHLRTETIFFVSCGIENNTPPPHYLRPRRLPAAI